MPRWEYAILSNGGSDHTMYRVAFSNGYTEDIVIGSDLDLLGKMGDEGWELVIHYSRQMIFKRQVEVNEGVQ